MAATAVAAGRVADAARGYRARALTVAERGPLRPRDVVARGDRVVVAAALAQAVTVSFAVTSSRCTSYEQAPRHSALARRKSAAVRIGPQRLLDEVAPSGRQLRADRAGHAEGELDPAVAHGPRLQPGHPAGEAPVLLQARRASLRRSPIGLPARGAASRRGERVRAAAVGVELARDLAPAVAQRGRPSACAASAASSAPADAGGGAGVSGTTIGVGVWTAAAAGAAGAAGAAAEARPSGRQCPRSPGCRARPVPWCSASRRRRSVCGSSSRGGRTLPWPQQRTAPPWSVTHVCRNPALIAVAPPAPTSTGPTSPGCSLSPIGASVSVAELAVGSIAPAAHLAVVEHGAGVLVARVDRGRGAPGAEIDRHDGAGCLVVSDRARVAVAEAAAAVVAPAAHAAVRQDGAGVAEPGGDRLRGQERAARLAEVHRPGPVGRHAQVAADVDDVAVAEPAVAAEAPAFDRVIVEQRARVKAAGGDGLRGASEAEVDRRDRAGQLVVADGDGVAQAEPAVEGEAPAAQHAVDEQCAGVSVARADRLRGERNASRRAEEDRSRRGGRLVVADRGRVAVAEPAVRTVAPAADRAVVEQRARMDAAGADRLGGATRTEVDRPDEAGTSSSPMLRRVAVSERPVAAIAPAAHLPGDQCAGVGVAGRELAGGGGGRLRRLVRDRAARSRDDDRERRPPAVSAHGTCADSVGDRRAFLFAEHP